MRRTLPGLLVVLSALGATGCGSSGSSDSAGDPAAQHGGTLTLLTTTPVGSLDPGRASGSTAATVLGVVDRTLYTDPAPGRTELTPDLAGKAPAVSPDRRTVTVTLRQDVRFAPPVSRRVTAQDVAYAISRVMAGGARDPRSARPFEALEGVAAYRAGTAPSVSGLRTPDERTIVFRLTQPGGPAFRSALTSLVTSPVPPEYASKFDAERPSTYDEQQIATGPYMIRADRLGKLTGVDAATRTLSLIRNPNWDEATDDRLAYVDAIDVRTVKDAARARRRVARGVALLGELPDPVRSKDVHAERRDGTWDLASAWLGGP
jgi:peptide/nickel transport system substrate-binding protein